MKRLFYGLMLKVFGPPVCPGCDVHLVPCVGWCGKDEETRIQEYYHANGINT